MQGFFGNDENLLDLLRGSDCPILSVPGRTELYTLIGEMLGMRTVSQ